MISRFHYLTQDIPGVSHEELAEIACANGIRWVQLRVKNKPFGEWLQIAKNARKITDKYNASLIINDHPEIALLSDADGVHLGKNDMPAGEARKILGDGMIIGGTANTLDDILRLEKQGVNYIGLGPFRFTSTKKNLSPVLGLSGYEIVARHSPLVPVIAIGGIQIDDVQPLLQTGIHGLAVSSAINLSENKTDTIQAFLNQFSLTSK